MSKTVKTINKFTAAKLYDAGCAFALFHHGLPDWDGPFFHAGYTYGLTLKEGYSAARNTCLVANGHNPIHKIVLAAIDAEYEKIQAAHAQHRKEMQPEHDKIAAAHQTTAENYEIRINTKAD